MTSYPESSTFGAVSTGHAGVDQAIAGLAELDHLPVDQHADRLTDVHEQLHRSLNELRTNESDRS